MRAAVLLALLATFTGLPRPAPAFAQISNLAVTGFPVAFPAVTGAHFSAGFVDAGNAITFTVNAQGAYTGQRLATVSIRCNSPCPARGSKPLSTLRWRRSDLATWNTLTTSNTVVEARTMVLNGLNDPWSNQILWRFNLDWLNDPPGAASNFNMVFTLTISLP